MKRIKMEEESAAFYSPSWKKPSDVVKNFKRNRALQARCQGQNIYARRTESCSDLTTRVSNPFRKIQSSKIQKNELDLSTDKTIFQLLSSKPESSSISDEPIVSGQPKAEIESFAKHKEESTENKWEALLPVDWSLKMHLRLLSSVPFSWNAGTRKTTEEASGITGFVRCLHSHQGELDTSASAQLHQRCLYWMHPSLPWLNLFPRQGEQISGAPVIMSSVKIKQSLFQEWCSSLRSLFQLLRSRQNPYFYICASNFTALFRAAGIGGVSDIHAMITPTTSGMRKALKDDGIIYTMPLQKRNSLDNLQNKTISEESAASTSDKLRSSDETIKTDDNDEVASWMANAGMQSAILSSLQKKIDQEEKQNDNHPESLIYMEGTEVQALYNFLMNAPNLCISSSGPSVGVPATLLAPVGFQGGTLKSLSVKQSCLRTNTEILHCLDLHGPILPHVVHSLVQLDSLVTSQDYDIILHMLKSTSSFSTDITAPFVPSAFAKQGLLDCGLHPDILELFCSTRKCITLNEIHFKKGLFNWS